MNGYQRTTGGLNKIASSALYREEMLKKLSREDLMSLLLSSQHSNADSGEKRDTNLLGKRESERTEEQKPASKRKEGRGKEFDMSKYGQHMIALRLVYLGWCHHGFASQPDNNNSVEDHLFASLQRTRLIQRIEDAAYSRSGRTDVGVSASDQVIGVRVRSNIVPPSKGDVEIDYVRTLNSALPKSIRVMAWAHAPNGEEDDGPKFKAVQRRRPGTVFSARFDATYRAYKYYFVKGGMDIEAMREAASYMVGRHDFRHFCKIDPTNVKSFVREMHVIDIFHEENESVNDEFQNYFIYVRGQAFLWHQVRCMAAILFEVGCGREAPDITRRMLEDVRNGAGAFAGGKPHYQIAPPTPLVLCECAYPPGLLTFRSTTDTTGRLLPDRRAFERADADLSSAFGNAMARSSVLRLMLDQNDKVKLLAGDDVECSYEELRAPRLLVEGMRKTRNHTHLEKRARGKVVEEKMDMLEKRHSSEIASERRELCSPAASTR